MDSETEVNSSSNELCTREHQPCSDIEKHGVENSAVTLTCLNLVNEAATPSVVNGAITYSDIDNRSDTVGESSSLENDVVSYTLHISGENTR